MVRLNCDEVDFPAENWELVKLLFLNLLMKRAKIILIFWEGS